jgi:TonB family protein
MASMFRPATLSLLTLLLAMPVTSIASNVEPASPIDRPAPDYPDAAGGASGRVTVQFTIDAQGRISDAKVVESTLPGVFDNAAVSAVKTWRYLPRRVDGRAVEQPANRIALEFKPAPGDPAHTPVVTRSAPVYYPREAYLAGQEGDVTVAFDIDENGFARNARVVTAPVPKVFDRAAILVVTDSHFRAPVVDGAPMAATGLQIVVEFRLSTARIPPRRIDHTVLTYPPSELSKGQPGYCYVTMSIAGDGSVDGAEVIDTAPGVEFRKPCLDYARQHKFDPPDQDPTGRVARTYSMTIRFFIAGSSQRLLQPGEWVRIRYTLGADGQVKDPEVVATSSPDLNTDGIVRNFKLHRLKPIIENGVPVEKPGRLMIMSGDPF